MTFVFNELSAVGTACTTHDARDRVATMVKAIATLAGDRSTKLMTIGSFDLYSATLADGYTIYDWLTDPTTDRDLRELLWKISTKVAFDEDVPEAVKDRFYLSEFQLDDQEARGLGLAYLLATAAVSVRSAEWWERVHIRLRHTWLDVDEVEHSHEIVSLNITDRDQADTVNDELLKWARDELTGNLTGLADRKQECFPYLQFGTDVDKQLSSLSRDTIEQVVGKLIVLDGAVRDWRRDRTDALGPPKVNSESEPTMQQYRNRRIFRDVNGIPKEYRLHAMVGKSHRIHLAVDQGTKTLEIGYIGEHLPTVRFRH